MDRQGRCFEQKLPFLIEIPSRNKKVNEGTGSYHLMITGSNGEYTGMSCFLVLGISYQSLDRYTFGLKFQSHMKDHTKTKPILRRKPNKQQTKNSEFDNGVTGSGGFCELITRTLKSSSLCWTKVCFDTTCNHKIKSRFIKFFKFFILEQ